MLALLKNDFMILKEEIRIGNWFEHNANWCYRSPAEIKPFQFKWEDRDWYAVGECTMDLEDLQPIPLDTEMLLKCGFEKNEFNSGITSGIEYSKIINKEGFKLFLDGILPQRDGLNLK